jgi:flagellar biosynthetic protein FlhB
MAEEEKEQDQKTEDPTAKRLEDARNKGQVFHSREVNSFMVLSFATLFILMVMPYLSKKAAHELGEYITSVERFGWDYDADDAMRLALGIFGDIIGLILLPLFIAFIGAIIGNLMQNGILFSNEPIMPKLSKISPFAGFKRIFSMRSVVEFIKGIFKVIVITVAIYIAVTPHLDIIKTLHDMALATAMAHIMLLIRNLLLTVCIIMLFIALADYAYQRHEFMKKMRMTREEVKEEHKQTDGNPEIKAKLKSIRRERAKQMLASTVPTADVVITNPTHYSVALKYDEDSMNAPIVVAKGLDNIALRIREIAGENNIPLVENPPLARALYAAVEVEEEIPFEHYKAVAEVISYVMKMKHKT